MTNIVILILILFALTYSSRLLGLELFSAVTLSPLTKRYFNYVPVAIMVALLMKQLIHYDGKTSSLSLPVLVGGLVCTVVMKFKENFLLAMLLGMAAGLLIRYLIQ